VGALNSQAELWHFADRSNQSSWIHFEKDENMKSFFALLVAAGLLIVAGCDSPKVQKANEEMKQAGRDAVEAGKEAAHELGEAGKDATHEAAHAVKEGAEKVEEETR
jgi:hypothetical protein